MNRSPDRTNRGSGRGRRSDRGSLDPGPTAFELDPEIHPDRWESMVARIMERARPILEARRQQTLEGTLSRWRRPVMLGSAGLAAAAAAVLLWLPGGDAGTDEVSFAEVMMPWPVAAWMEGSYAPTAGELVLAIEEYLP